MGNDPALDAEHWSLMAKEESEGKDGLNCATGPAGREGSAPRSGGRRVA